MQLFDVEDIREALAKGIATKEKFEEIEYIRFRSSYKKIERGSVFTKDSFFPGFPHIKRIFTLANGLKRNFGDNFVYAEEKIDGYNLRAVYINKKIVGISRGGIIDAFATEKLQNILNKEVFEENKVMLCGEMIGNTPFTKPVKDFDVKYLIFDIYDLEKMEFLEIENKYKLIKKYSLPSVPLLGKFNIKNDLPKLQELVKSANRGKKEGIVFKSPDRKKVVKYVNPLSDIEDIKQTLKQIFDMPVGFFNQRLIRSGVFIKENALNVSEYAEKIGKAIYESIEEGIKMIQNEGEIYDEFEILIKRKDILKEIEKHMSKDVKIKVIFEREENSGFRIRFKKVYLKSTKRFKEILGGKGFVD